VSTAGHGSESFKEGPLLRVLPKRWLLSLSQPGLGSLTTHSSDLRFAQADEHISLGTGGVELEGQPFAFNCLPIFSVRPCKES
jgi:hypothetical protein